ncbi:hypothetical protein [Novosphingobium cyanobacteriorum]|uniref:Uncharacterized protein n=1 Tax=Novosphingobium cyanobacteriorum TaxID=3024215 RepID=A0ABT6CFZ3_9SPHN|nr:hypothetical protein [Novosphingobium cyanobacteriorum]MDF8332844.1 hypothetical protein [Novosphingobium cyanobacteriorum]
MARAVAAPGRSVALRIKVMPDYECAPLWWDGGDRVGDVPPEELGLPDALCRDLWDWAARHDATLDRDDPARSGFGSDEALKAFEAEGLQLTRRVAEALGDTARVRWWRER